MEIYVHVRVFHVHAHVQHFLTFQYFASHIHIFQSVHVARVSHSMRCLASRTNWDTCVRMQMSCIFCHMHMTWCTCACTYVLHAHVCAQIQHFLTFQTSLRTSTFSDRCTLQLPAGVTACVAMLPRLKNKRVRMQMSCITLHYIKPISVLYRISLHRRLLW